MRLLRGYIRRSVTGPFLFSLGACTGLLLVNQLAKRFGDLVGKDLPWQVIVEVLALSIPFIIALTLPMAVLVAILYGYSQLGQDNEITAMRASGVSVFQMLAPGLVGGLLLAVINFLFVDQVLPRTNARLGNLQSDISQKKPAFQMREQAINTLHPYSIRAGTVFPGSGRMKDLEIFDVSLIDSRRVVYADSGIMAFDDRGVDLILQLFKGKVHEYKLAEPAKIQITRFDQNTIRVRNVQNLFERDTLNFHRGDREMTTCEMMDQVSASRRRALRAGATRRFLAVQDLRSLMRVSQSGESPRIADTTRIYHCGRWRDFERAVGKMLLPEVIQAVPAAVPAAAPPPPAARIAQVISQQTSAGVPTPLVLQQPAPAPAPPPIRPSTVPMVPDQAVTVDTTTPVPPVDLTNPPVLSNLTETISTAQDERSSAISADKYLVEIHKKYAISVACFTFVLIGVALALRFPRGGMGLVIGGGLAIFAVFYVGLVGGEALADRGFLSPAVAMWTPNVFVMLVGLIGLLRIRREFGSTRGGDTADLFETLTRPFRIFSRRRQAV